VSDKHIQLQLETCQGTPLTIDYAGELAQHFFRTNASSVGPKAYDAWVLKGAYPNRITVGDVAAVNGTMVARTPYKRWTSFTEAETDEPWLAVLDPEWDLYAMPEREWLQHVVRRPLGEAFKAILGPYRRSAVVTKVLHIKRPLLVPICDSYVASAMGVTFGDEANWRDLLNLVMHLRRQGQTNLDSLVAIQEQLRKAGIERSLVRILDALLWMRGAKDGPDASFAEWLHQTFDGGD